MTEQRKSVLAIASIWVWCIPLLPLGLAIAIYIGELQTPTFLFINRYTQILPDTVWAWLTFIGNGWGIFALLLVGRHGRGWRGRQATRWLYAGALVLLLAYVGSRFVLEVLLSRTLA